MLVHAVHTLKNAGQMNSTQNFSTRKLLILHPVEWEAFSVRRVNLKKA